MESIHLPRDVALLIVSFLQDTDVCSLGSCSRFWRRICSSDAVWFDLARLRWPSFYFPRELELDCLQGEDGMIPQKVGKRLYKDAHKMKAYRVSEVAHFVKKHSESENSLEGAIYLTAVWQLSSLLLSFKDIQRFIFSTKQTVLLNLIGLHHCLFRLNMTAEDVTKALSSCNIADRRVCVKWWKLGRWVQGYRLRDEAKSRRVSLHELVNAGDDEVVGILQRGPFNEVLRVQISVFTEVGPSWLRVQPSGF